ncbi:ABC transporter ATP-binding protein (plasmid) [Lactiplantibacillus argentoratensis]|uniref:ABC transporter ATP-binding protein n=1 Tax=Lactiplantibacillus argentoratensis TaxID=271881 RepID=A0AAN1UJQ7_9LACO|nr:ABC transporter ATP-binding protein [Lactiplantibacillus argentoratensis]
MVNTILKEADLFCPNSVRINFTIYHFYDANCKLVRFCFFMVSKSFSPT